MRSCRINRKLNGFGSTTETMHPSHIESRSFFGTAFRFNPKWFVALTLGYILTAFIISSFIADKLIDLQVQQAKEKLQSELALARYRIEATVFRDTYLADSLSTVIAINPEFADQEWGSVAHKLWSKASLVRNVAMAPDDVIKNVYPVEGNEKAIGLDFRTVPNQYRAVLKARETQQVVLAGPLELVQGGIGLIARYPIFTDAPRNEQYWGTVSVVLNYDKLIEDSGLFDVQGIETALVAYDPDSNEGRVIDGNESVMSTFDIQYPIYLPDGQWELFAQYKDLKNTDSVIGFKRIVMVFGSFTSMIVYILLVFLFNSYMRAQKLSLHDDLTHVPNRRFLLNELNRLMSEKQNLVEFTILNIDLNHFKGVNDTYGHEAGDELLKHVAQRLQHSLRSTDFVSRIGGDEFIVILHRTTAITDVIKAIHKIHLTFEESPLVWRNERIYAQLSVGHHSYSGEADPLAINEILTKADASMYLDKTK